MFQMDMFRVFIIALLLGLSLHAVTISFAEATKYVGQQVTVTGKVSGVRTIPSGMTFVNFGTRGATGAFTAVGKPGVVDGEALSVYEGKEVEVTGTVELYKDSPQIVLKESDSIRLAAAAPTRDSGTLEAVNPDVPKLAETSAPAFDIESLTLKLEREEVRMAGKAHSGFVPVKAEVFIAIPKDFKLQ